MTLANKNNLLYTSREFDFDIGLQFSRMRYYSPFLGRFNQYDFLIITNRYVYVKNNPLNLLDPFGAYGRGVAMKLLGGDYWDCVEECLVGCMICYFLPPGIAEICWVTCAITCLIGCGFA